MDYLLGQYDYYAHEVSDPRVKDWWGMDGPFVPITTISLYLVVVLKFLPWYMKDRSPYSLKTVIQYYNVFQIAANSFLLYMFFSSDLRSSCYPVDYSNRPLARRQLVTLYWTTMLKAFDMTETVFFMLRKKHNQVSFLHLYHHASTYLLGWLGVKYIGGGTAMFPPAVNTGIHIIMYSYYMFASLGPEWQNRLKSLKPKLTMIQMIQFCVLLWHASIWYSPQCIYPKWLLVFYIPDLFLIFYMFWDFYKKSYLRQKNNRK